MDTKITRDFVGAPVPIWSLLAFASSAATGLLVFAVFLGYVVRTGKVSEPTNLLIFGTLSSLYGALLLASVVKAIRTRSRSAVIVVSSDGICDWRISKKTIPWGAIDGIASVKARRGRSKIMLLTLDPAFENEPDYVRSLRLSAWLNRLGGRRGVQVTSTGLKASLDELMNVAVAYKKVALDETPIAKRAWSPRSCPRRPCA